MRDDCRYWIASGNHEVKWALDSVTSPLLPKMMTDIWVEKDKGGQAEKLFILDTKYYAKTVNRYGNLISHNLYQLLGYMTNAKYNARDAFQEVHGCLLYAKSGDKLDEDIHHQVGTVSVRTVDLTREWPGIFLQLQEIWASIDDEGDEAIRLNRIIA